MDLHKGRRDNEVVKEMRKMETCESLKQHSMFSNLTENGHINIKHSSIGNLITSSTRYEIRDLEYNS